ncbi:hypothetical protein JOD96_002453 [Flavobacterium sp. 1355]|nr:hypothetical protein [Flavobacterium sp. 1355]
MKNLLLAGFVILSINLINAQSKVNVYLKILTYRKISI